jgi:hypothetical protein
MNWGTLNGKTYYVGEEMYNDIKKIIGNEPNRERRLEQWNLITHNQPICETIYKYHIMEPSINIYPAVVALLILLLIVMSL